MHRYYKVIAGLAFLSFFGISMPVYAQSPLEKIAGNSQALEVIKAEEELRQRAARASERKAKLYFEMLEKCKGFVENDNVYAYEFRNGKCLPKVNDPNLDGWGYSLLEN